MDDSSGNTASTAKKDLFASPTRVVDSSKKRNLKLNFKQSNPKNSTLEASGSPLRKAPEPLLSSTPIPTTPKKTKKSFMFPDMLFEEYDPLLRDKKPVVVLDRTVVDRYFAKETAAAETTSKQADSPSQESSKKQETKKQAMGKKTKRTPKSTNTARGRPKKQATVTPEGSIETPRAAKARAKREDACVKTVQTENSSEHQRMPIPDTVVTKIPSEVLQNFGIDSHQDVDTSQSSIITEPLSPAKTKERTPSPDQNGNTPTTTSSAYYSPHDTPTPSANEHVFSSSPVPEGSRASNIDVSPLKTASTEKDDDTLALVCDSDLLCELEHRLFESPKALRLHELKAGSKDARRVAPYCLKIADNDEKFFMYAAALAYVSGKYCCLVFGIVDGRLVAYGGHFIVPKERIYDPVLKTPVKDVNLTKLPDCRHHFGLFNIRNVKLLEYDDYFEAMRQGPYRALQEKFVDSFLNAVDQIAVKEKARWENAVRENQSESRSISTQAKAFPVTTSLKEPRTEQAFFETCLPISQERVDSILKFVCSMGNVKKRFGELAVMQANCALQPTFDTAYYVAHEDSGCTAFYPTSYLLGRIDDHYVVGVIVRQSFFIMATKRVFSRFDELNVGLQPVLPSNELFESIHLPLWLSHEYSLIMLETRQILKQPLKYQEEMRELSQALGIAGFRSKSLDNSFIDMASATQSNSRSLHNAWLAQTLEGFFNDTFRNSPCQFPTHPASVENPQMFCENMLKLWLQRLQREIHGIEESDILISYGATSLSQLEFFTLDPVSFAEHFLPVFGLSSKHTFRCLALNSHGVPSGVCEEVLSATDVAKHVEECHVRPLFWDSSNPTREFTPFVLVFSNRDNPPLSETCDSNLLSWALSMAANRLAEPGSSYVKFVQGLSQSVKSKSSSEKSLTTPGEKQKMRRKSSPGQPLVMKRKRSVEEVLDEELKRRCVDKE